MKKILVILTVLIILLSACAQNEEPASDLTIEDILNEYQQPEPETGKGEAAIPEEEQLPTNAADCYQDGNHPIGVSIAGQFKNITSYEEVMLWFCNGAEFEDILNALATEEITTVDAEEVLNMLADGMSWDEIWLELGVTEE